MDGHHAAGGMIAIPRPLAVDDERHRVVGEVPRRKVVTEDEHGGVVDDATAGDGRGQPLMEGPLEPRVDQIVGLALPGSMGQWHRVLALLVVPVQLASDGDQPLGNIRQRPIEAVHHPRGGIALSSTP